MIVESDGCVDLACLSCQLIKKCTDRYSPCFLFVKNNEKLAIEQDSCLTERHNTSVAICFRTDDIFLGVPGSRIPVYNDRVLYLPLPEFLGRISEILNKEACFKGGYGEWCEATFEYVHDDFDAEGVPMEIETDDELW